LDRKIGLWAYANEYYSYPSGYVSVDAPTGLDVDMKKKKQSSVAQEVLLYASLFSGFGWLISTYRVLFGPLIISGLISYLLYPGVTWIAAQTRIDRRKIVPLVYFIFLISLVFALIYLVPTIVKQANLLTSQLVKIPGQAEIVEADLEILLGFNLPIGSFVEELEKNIVNIVKPDRIFRVLQGVSTNIVWVIIIFITSFHLLRDWPRLREWLFRLSPAELEPDLRRIHEEIKILWQTYLRGQLLIMLILGIVSGVGVAIIGVPGALILGFLAGTLALIPSLGPAIATGVAALVAWNQGSTHFGLSNLAATLIVIAIFQVIQLIEGFWLTPRIMGRRLNLHPGLILIAVVGTLFTLGALMALIIIPILGSFELVLRYAYHKRAGLDPWPAEEIQEETA